jgi:hypothetical protein
MEPAVTLFFFLNSTHLLVAGSLHGAVRRSQHRRLNTSKVRWLHICVYVLIDMVVVVMMMMMTLVVMCGIVDVVTSSLSAAPMTLACWPATL